GRRPARRRRLSEGIGHRGRARHSGADGAWSRAMTVARPAFERRVLSALEARPARIPVLVGSCGTGRTYLLRRLRERLGESGCQYIDVERSATTPERLLRTVLAASPFSAADVGPDARSP